MQGMTQKNYWDRWKGATLHPESEREGKFPISTLVGGGGPRSRNLLFASELLHAVNGWMLFYRFQGFHQHPY